MKAYTVRCPFGCERVLLVTDDEDRAEQRALAHAVGTTHTVEIEDWEVQ